MTTETKTDPKPSVIPYKREAIDIYALIDFIPGEPEAQPDAMLQEPILTESVITPLADWLTDGGIDRTVFVSSDTILCYDRSDLNIRIQPDCYVAFGVDVQAIRERELYLPWEVGKVPDFALEVASRTTARRDRTTKRDIYRRIGVPELWLVDGTGGEMHGAPLIGWRLEDSEYAPIPITAEPDGGVSGYSPAIGLRLTFAVGRFRFQDPSTGEYLVDTLEDRRAHRDTLAALDDERAEHESTRTNLNIERLDHSLTRSERDAERAERERIQSELERERERIQSELEREREMNRRLQERIRRMEGGGGPPQA